MAGLKINTNSDQNKIAQFILGFQTQKKIITQHALIITYFWFIFYLYFLDVFFINQFPIIL